MKRYVHILVDLWPIVVLAAFVGFLGWAFSPDPEVAPPPVDRKAAKHTEFRSRVHLVIDREGKILEHHCNDPKCSAVIGAVWSEDAVKNER